MQTIGTRLSTFEQVLAIAEADPGIFCSVGVHPHRADEEGVDDPAPLVARTRHAKVIGIGESGLDYYYDNSSRAGQERSFRAHIQAARESRPAADRAYARRRSRHHRPAARGHGRGAVYGRDPLLQQLEPELGFAAVEMGLYLGLGGILTFKRSEELRATVRALPLDRLILETDAPYLAPQPFRGKRNEPAYVAHVATTLAEVRSLPVAEIARATTDNFFRLFAKAASAKAPACARAPA